MLTNLTRSLFKFSLTVFMYDGLGLSSNNYPKSLVFLSAYSLIVVIDVFSVFNNPLSYEIFSIPPSGTSSL